MDDVDVFFGEDFHGKLFCPGRASRVRRGGVSPPQNLGTSRRSGGRDCALGEDRMRVFILFVCVLLCLCEKFRRLEGGFATFRKRGGHSRKEVR